MPNDIDKSLLDRLQALRGPSPNATPERAAPVKVGVDVIERSKTPTREDALAARLKSLRAHDEASRSFKVDEQAAQSTPEKSAGSLVQVSVPGDDVDAMFQTDDQTLEELLGEAGANGPSDDIDEAKALLDELSESISQDTADDKAGDSDDSDGERMQREVDDVIARFRDEMEPEAALGHEDDDDDNQAEDDQQQDQHQYAEDSLPNSDLALPSLPSNLDDLPSASSPPRASTADIDDITARMAALRAPQDSSSLHLPSVPSSKPSGKPVKRLASKTNYTDDDMDGWCTVCLEDATLQCPGCDDDVYCARCWAEMHVGPSAGFDERSHRAVQLTKAKKKEKRRIALGA